MVSFVWGIGQRTPIHDHMTWGVIAMLRGAERAERYERAAPMRLLGESVLLPGDVDRVSPRLGDIHRVSNACDDRVSISIHIYGGNIGRIPRHVYDVDTGARRASFRDTPTPTRRQPGSRAWTEARGGQARAPSPASPRARARFAPCSKCQFRCPGKALRMAGRNRESRS